MQNNVAEVLLAMAKGDKNRSETARLRDVFAEIEAALNAGVRRAAILEALHGQGFTMTLKSFESALYRIRKQEAKTGSPSLTAPVVPSAPPVSPEVVDTSPANNSAVPDKKQQREKFAEKYVGDKTTPKNTIASRLINQEKK